MSFSRRNVLHGLLGIGAAGVTGRALAKGVPEPVRVDDPRQSYPTPESTEDLYRAEFAATYGDGEEHGFAYHCVNCQGNCAWEVWVKDGKITRENQSAQYPAIAPDVPDANPRGCNKGVQHSQVLYEADRLLYPMRRAGARGEGKWKRISWDEAITEVATKLYDTMLSKGPAGNYIHIGAGVLTEARAASVKRLGTLLGAVRPYIASYVGDMFPGVSVVYGEGNIGCTYDFIYQSNVNVFWGCNPNTSRIPDAHYLWEGKYNGSKIIVITPEYSSTAIHADLWVPVKPGYDGHLALSIIERMVERRLYNARFLQTFTDLPFLVRTDTQALVRLEEVDLADPRLDRRSVELFAGDATKHHGVFLAFDRAKKKIAVMPGSEGATVDTLRLEDLDWRLDPALEGRWRLKLRDGKEVEVTTAFSLWKRELSAYRAEKVQKLTGVHPTIVDELARDLAKAKVALITMGFAVGKHFNGMLSQRAIASLAAFTGRLGPTGGMNTENEWNITGLSGLSSFDGRYTHRFASGFVSEFMLGDGFADADRHFAEEDVQRATGQSKADYTRAIKAQLEASAGDAGEKNGKPWWRETETFLLFGDSRFRRNKGHYRQAFLEKAKFLAYGDFRISDFARWADVLLPCTTPYESWDIRTNPGYHRFANLAVPPAGLKKIGESKSEWEIARLIAEKMQAIALERYAKTKDERYLRIPDPTHAQSGFHAMDELVKEFTLEGKLRTDRDAVEFALEHVDQFKPSSPKSMVESGGFLQLNEKAGRSSPLYRNKPYNTFESNLFLHQRFETLTGRLTFYVDHPLWIEAGAHVPAAHEPIRPKRFPFLLMTPHARWSIHSTYKTSPILQRLQRGKPYVMINPEVAKGHGIQDGEDVKLFNDLGEVVLMAKIAGGVPPDAVVMEHGWEPFMYQGKKGHNVLNGDLLNLLEVTDGWGHLKFGTHWDGNQHAYEATVGLAKA
ncbi:MAG: molybdopterin-dependent oxidoreductase [Deltaproteobacteria bacterium]|nr:molybdopterin-dependent oxidoreductase [Deltaproteobacteria bacterium]